MPVYLRWSRIAVLGLKLPPGRVPQSAAGPATVDAEMNMFWNEEGVLVDVRNALSMEPPRKILRLGKEVMADPSAWWKGGRRWLGVEVAVEAKGKDRLGGSRPADGLAPPPSREGVGTRDVEGPASPGCEQHLARRHFPAAEEAALLSILLAQQDEAPLVLTALLPRGHDLGGLTGLVEGCTRGRAGGEQRAQQGQPELR
jgi:hypothetical protein